MGRAYQMGLPPTADLAQMQDWAAELMSSRRPDVVIDDGSGGTDYMHRWFVVPRNPMLNVYLHRIMRSDKDVPHDHPWDNTSFLISGRYDEYDHETMETLRREAGSVVSRPATAAHRLIILPGEEAISLFVTGPKVREWGFHCPKRWVHWADFVDSRDKGRVGLGCGED